MASRQTAMRSSKKSAVHQMELLEMRVLLSNPTVLTSFDNADGRGSQRRVDHAATGAGQQEQRTFDVRHGCLLLRI